MKARIPGAQGGGQMATAVALPGGCSIGSLIS